MLREQALKLLIKSLFQDLRHENIAQNSSKNIISRVLKFTKLLEKGQKKKKKKKKKKKRKRDRKKLCCLECLAA